MYIRGICGRRRQKKGAKTIRLPAEEAIKLSKVIKAKRAANGGIGISNS
jgi:hypothetical protein